jgi:hypothetical protein
MTSPDRDPELEQLLRAALHAEAARTTPAGDGLARIRERTAAKAGFGRLFRPALAGAALTFTLVAGTLIGINMTDDDGPTDFAQPVATGDPVVNPPVVNPPAQTGPAQDPPVTLLPPTTAPSSAPSSVPSAAPSIAAKVTAPPTGLATPATECVPDMGVPVDDGGNYIAITSPGSGCPVVGPSITVSGKARVWEASLSIDVMQNNVVLHTANVTASEGAPGLGTWSTAFSLPPGNYRIEAYWNSPADGARMTEDVIWITVTAP